MKSLIVDDDATNRLFLIEILKPYGDTEFCVNGKAAVDAFRTAMETNSHFDLVCLDIRMPGMDGHATLKQIRAIEESYGIVSSQGSKIVMVSAMGDMNNVMTAYSGFCDAYIVKPIDRNKVLTELRKLKLIT